MTTPRHVDNLVIRGGLAGSMLVIRLAAAGGSVTASQLTPDDLVAQSQTAAAGATGEVATPGASSATAACACWRRMPLRPTLS